MADLLVVSGPPGAGKSTVAALLVAGLDVGALVPGDDFFAFWQRGAVAPWLPEAAGQNTAVITAAAATGRMHDDSSAAVGELPQRHLLRDTSSGPHELAALVAERWRSGDLLVGA